MYIPYHIITIYYRYMFSLSSAYYIANIFPNILRDGYRSLSRFSKPPTESCGPEAPFVAKAGTVVGTLGASGGGEKGATRDMYI